MEQSIRKNQYQTQQISFEKLMRDEDQSSQRHHEPSIYTIATNCDEESQVQYLIKRVQKSDMKPRHISQVCFLLQQQISQANSIQQIKEMLACSECTQSSFNLRECQECHNQVCMNCLSTNMGQRITCQHSQAFPMQFDDSRLQGLLATFNDRCLRCKQWLKPDEFQAHEAFCSSFTYSCPSLVCKKDTKFDTYLDFIVHFANKHQTPYQDKVINNKVSKKNEEQLDELKKIIDELRYYQQNPILETNVKTIYTDELCGRLVNNKLQGYVRVYNKKEDSMQHLYYFKNRQQSSFKMITNSTNQIIKLGFMKPEEDQNHDNSRIYHKQDESPTVTFLLHGYGMKIINLPYLEQTEGFYKNERELEMVPYNKLINRGKEYFYIGEWMDGKPNGHGKLHKPHGEYIGHFKNEKLEGQGEYISIKNCVRSVGKWKDGKLDGQGKKIFNNGDSVEGIYSQGELIGAYTHQTQQGEVRQIWPVDGSTQYVHMTFSMIERNSETKVLCEYSGPVTNWSNIQADKCLVHLLTIDSPVPAQTFEKKVMLQHPKMQKAERNQQNKKKNKDDNIVSRLMKGQQLMIQTKEYATIEEEILVIIKQIIEGQITPK
ncbi:hypothetical protein FGO68_gene14589 [Halteria grandinella]|uniref:Uncharacterized protein n=1 Tax=Halteria grandinella TaxID=5974 RepID=A0A8J8NTE9_HALGN|nr:hypothetical protein FGO68_gene14589 [Halteria grandinella]